MSIKNVGFNVIKSLKLNQSGLFFFFFSSHLHRNVNKYLLCQGRWQREDLQPIFQGAAAVDGLQDDHPWQSISPLCQTVV